MTPSNISNDIEHLLLPPSSESNSVAIISNTASLTFDYLVEQAQGIRRLISRGAVTKGEPILLVAPDGPLFVAGLLGTLLAGCIPAPLTARSTREIISLLTDELSIRHILGVDSKGAWSITPTTTRNKPWLPFQGQPGVFRFSSGTTSPIPKAVALSLSEIVERTEMAREALLIDRGDRVLWTMSMPAHFVVSILMYLRNGISIALADTDSAEPLAAQALALEANVLYGSPSEVRKLTLPKQPRWDGLAAAYSTAGTLSPILARDFFDQQQLPLMPLYGMVEVGLPFYHGAIPTEPTISVGSVAPYFEIAIDNILEVAGLEPLRGGALSVRGPGVASGYVRGQSIQSIRDPEGWVNTGDIVAITPAGYQVLGRLGSSMNYRGRYLIPEVFEAQISDHPGIAECRVELRSNYTAMVVVVPNHPPAGLSANAKQEISKIVLKAGIGAEIAVTSSIARTVTGKVIRG